MKNKQFRLSRPGGPSSAIAKGGGHHDTLDDGDFYYYDDHRVIAQYKTKPPQNNGQLLPFNKTVDNTDASFSPEPRALARAEADTPVIAVADKNNATTKTSTVNHQFIQGGSTPPSQVGQAIACRLRRPITLQA